MANIKGSKITKIWRVLLQSTRQMAFIILINETSIPSVVNGLITMYIMYFRCFWTLGYGILVPRWFQNMAGIPREFGFGQISRFNMIEYNISSLDV